MIKNSNLNKREKKDQNKQNIGSNKSKRENKSKSQAYIFKIISINFKGKKNKI